MSELVYQRIVEFLKENKVSYQIFEHEPVYTSEQASKVRGTSLSGGAKALIFLADGSPVMVVVPGNRRVDVKKFKQMYRVGDLRMATPEEVKKTTEGVEIGAVHPFGNLHKIPVYVDEHLGRNSKISFNVGLHTKSAEISWGDYYRLVKPKLGSFTFLAA